MGVWVQIGFMSSGFAAVGVVMIGSLLFGLGSVGMVFMLKKVVDFMVLLLRENIVW